MDVYYEICMYKLVWLCVDMYYAIWMYKLV